MALGVLFLIDSAMVDPVWFASRMQGLALVGDWKRPYDHWA